MGRDGRMGLFASEAELQAAAEGEGQTGVADGADVLVVGEVVDLGEEGGVVGQVVGEAEVELDVAKVEIAVGEEEGVGFGGIDVAEEG